MKLYIFTSAQPLCIPGTKRIAAETLCNAMRLYEAKYPQGARFLVCAKLECEINDVDLCIAERVDNV